MEGRKTELLAPAGNRECLEAAVNSGADAVYLAGKSFGARSYAENFSQEALAAGIDYCHLRGVKVYVTVNTLTLDREFPELETFAADLAAAGADAVIVQDLGVLRRLRALCPTLPLHASTQMTVHNLAGVKALEALGVSRVVLARELAAADLAEICRGSRAELEIFVHGALCMSYSGQCLLSSVLGGRSGNRGRCAQPCRLVYRPEQGREGHYLSLKDLSLLHHLTELKDLGVASLKIEGRMKGPAYVAAVTGIYRACLDQGRGPTRAELNRLNRVFFRGGLTDGYFTGRTGPGMFAFAKPDNPYEKGMGLPETAPPPRRAPVACRGLFREGFPPELTLKGLGETATVRGGEPLAPARSNPSPPEDVKKQLCKTGDTAFVLEPVTLEMEGRPFVPVGVVNRLRREAVGALEAAILRRSVKPVRPLPREPRTRREPPGTMAYTALVGTAAQFAVVREFPFAWIGAPVHLAAQNPEIFLPERERVILCPPAVLREGEAAAFRETLLSLRRLGFARLRAENVGWLAWGREFALWGGHRLNAANSQALMLLKEAGLTAAALSPELNLAQIRDLDKALPVEALLYGHLPLMVTENCIMKNLDGCPCGGGGGILDRRGIRFPIVRDGDSCRSVLLNSVPLYMGDKKEAIQEAGVDFGQLLFTVETPETCRKVCQCCWAGSPWPEAYTRLHYYKGVEKS